MLKMLCKIYVEKQVEESKNSSSADEDYYMGYFQSIYDILHANGYNYEQISRTIKDYQKELNLSYVK